MTVAKTPWRQPGSWAVPMNRAYSAHRNADSVPTEPTASEEAAVTPYSRMVMMLPLVAFAAGYPTRVERGVKALTGRPGRTIRPDAPMPW